jgi:hypothetical protein
MLLHYLVVQRHYKRKQLAQTYNNITPNKTLVITFSDENNLHAVAMRRRLALNGRIEGHKHDLETPDGTEFSDVYLAKTLLGQ